MSRLQDNNDALAAAMLKVAESITHVAEAITLLTQAQMYQSNVSLEQVALRSPAQVEKLVQAEIAAAGIDLKPATNALRLTTPEITDAELTSLSKRPDVKPVLTYTANVKPMAQAVLVKKGREALLKLLAEFGVQSATKLTEDEFENFCAAAEKAVAE